MTTCWTQAGEEAAVGSMTCAASPPAILGWACKIPSRIQIRPNPTRSSRRPGASQAPPPSHAHRARVPLPVLALPVLALPVLALPVLALPELALSSCLAAGVLIRQVRAVAHSSHRKARMMTAIAPWCSSADLNAATSIGSAGFRPEFMPGTDGAPLLGRAFRLVRAAPGGCWPQAT